MLNSLKGMESKKAKIGRTCQRCRVPRRKQKPIASSATESARADLIEVSSMPAKWVPRRGGPILSNYLKKQEKDETTIVQETEVNVTKLNVEINAKIRTLAQNLNSIIEQNQMHIHCVLDNCKPIEDKLTDESRDKALVEIKQLYFQRVDEIAQFKKEAMALEKTRADGLRELLSNCCNRLVAVGKQIPRNVVLDFDRRAYEFNMQQLNNARAYSELEAKLCAQADAKISQARSILNQFCLSVKFVLNASPQPLISPSDSGTRKDNVEVFKESYERIADKYRNELQKGFNNFTTQLIELRKDIENHHYKEHVTVSFESPELREIDQEFLQLVIDTINRQLISENLAASLYDNVQETQRIIAQLGEELQLTFDILNDAGHVSDSYVMRSALARKLITSAVEDLITKNDSIELENEIKFDIDFEKMRTSPDPHVLKNRYDVLVKFLRESVKLYNKHNQEEIKGVECFMDLHEEMVNILSVEFEIRLKQYQINGTEVLIAASVPRIHSSSVSPIELESQKQILDLRSWRNDLLETLQDNVSVANGLNLLALRWLDKKKSSLNVRYSTKMHSHSIRMERVQAARQIRATELQHHQNRLDSHLTALLNVIEPLPVNASEIFSIDDPSLYPLCSWVSQIQNDMNAMLALDPLDPGFKKLKMDSYEKRLAKHRTLFECSLDAAIEVFKKSVEKQLQEAMQSNVKFISAIKLFNEGGNYAVDEALQTSLALVEVADVINPSTLEMHKALNFRRRQLLAEADLLVKNLFKVKEESNKKKNASKTNLK